MYHHRYQPPLHLANKTTSAYASNNNYALNSYPSSSSAASSSPNTSTSTAPPPSQQHQQPTLSRPYSNHHHNNNNNSSIYINNNSNNSSNSSNNSAGLYSGLSKHYIEERQDVIFRKVRGILNKITPETFDKLSKELVNVGLDSPRTLRGVIYLLFDKALKDLKYSSLYAKLCQELSENAPNFEQEPGPNTFCKFLISKCEDEFERRRKATEDFENKNELTDEEYEQKAIVKQKMLGNIKFICELGKKRLLQEEILHECIRGLLSKKKERPIQDQAQDLECLCQIMRTIGSLLDVQASRNLMNQYFERIDLFSKKPELPPRIRFMLRDVIDLRNNNWRPRPFQREDNVPQPLSKLREEAGFEQHSSNNTTLDKYGNTTFVGIGDLSKLHGNKLSMLLDDEPSFTTSTDFHWGPSFLDQPTFDPFSTPSPSSLTNQPKQKPVQQSSNSLANASQFTANNLVGPINQRPPIQHDPFANQKTEPLRKQTINAPVRNNFESGNRFLDGVGGAFKRAPFRDMDTINPPRRDRENSNLNSYQQQQQQPLHPAISSPIVGKQSYSNNASTNRIHQQPSDDRGPPPGNFSNFNTSRRFGSGFRDDRMLNQYRDDKMLNQHRDPRASPNPRQAPSFQTSNQQTRRQITSQSILPAQQHQQQPNFIENSRQGPPAPPSSNLNRFDSRNLHGDRDNLPENNDNRRFTPQRAEQLPPNQSQHEPFSEHRQPRFSNTNFRQAGNRVDWPTPIGPNNAPNQSTHPADDMHLSQASSQFRGSTGAPLQTPPFQPHPNLRLPQKGNMVGGDSHPDKREPPRKFLTSINPQDRDQGHAPGMHQNQQPPRHHYPQPNSRFSDDGNGPHFNQERNFRHPMTRQRDMETAIDSDRSTNWRRVPPPAPGPIQFAQQSSPARDMQHQPIQHRQQTSNQHHPNQNHNNHSLPQHRQPEQRQIPQKQPANPTPQLAQTLGPLLPKPPTKLTSDANFSLRPSHNLAGRVQTGITNGSQSSSRQNQQKAAKATDKENFKPLTRFQESAQALPPPSAMPPVKLGKVNGAVGEANETKVDQATIDIETNSGSNTPKSDFQIEKFSTVLADFFNDPAPNMSRVGSKIKELKIPREHQHVCLVNAMRQSILKGEKDREMISKLLVSLLPTVFESASLIHAFKIIFEQLHSLEIETPKVKSLVAGFLSQATVDSLLSIEEIGNILSGGKHHPLFLLYLQKLGKSAGQSWLHEKFIASKINLMDMLPEADKSKERLASILKDRCLGYLDTMLTIEPDLMEQIKDKDSSPASIYRWIKDNVEQSIQNAPPFAQVLVTCLLQYIHNIAKTHAEQRESNVDAEQSSNKSSPSISSSQSTADVEKELLSKYQQILQAMLKDKQMQLAALYALQSFYYRLDFPKGSLLRWFHMLYDMNIVDSDVYFVWKEEINHDVPGKGQALFQVNTWLNWLAEAESEEEDEEEED